MAWQDELNNLDEELSSGRIRADEYRKRRDELLAAASSSSVDVRRVHRRQPPSIANAFTGDAKSLESSTDTTQQVNVLQTEQAKPPWESQAPAQQSQQQQSQQRGSARPAEPPSRTFAPVGQPGAPMQGSEVFGLAVSGPNTRRRWPRYVIAVVVLALVAGLTWWFAFRPREQAPVTTAPPPPPSQDVQLSVEKLPNPTDSPLSTSGVLTIDQAQLYNMIKPDEAGYLVAAGTEKVYCRAVSTGNLSFVLFAFQTKAGGGGVTLSERIAERGRGLGMADAEMNGLPTGVTALAVRGEKSTLAEATYGNGRIAVRIVVQQSDPGDRGQLTDALRRAVELTTKSIAVG
jgi:hypothetical protein